MKTLIELNNKRRNLLINPKFQLKVIGYFSLVSLFITAFLYIGLYFIAQNMIKQGIEAGVSTDNVYFKVVEQQLSASSSILIAIFIASLIFFIIVGTVISHKIAGPIFRICSTLSKCKTKEDFKEIKFRDSDYFPELAKEINHFIERI
ncbi:MAG: hypothetical protein HQK49_00480 [Oligoflexia bacterium]|nr:hypothetical protein [Oligoflexia bacterium]